MTLPFDSQIGIAAIMVRAANAYAGLKKLATVVPTRKVYCQRQPDGSYCVCPLTAIFLHETKAPLPDNIGIRSEGYHRLIVWARDNVFDGWLGSVTGFLFGIDYDRPEPVEDTPHYKFGFEAGRRAVERFKLAAPT